MDVQLETYSAKDADAMADLRAACAAADGFDPHSTLESLPSADEIDDLASESRAVIIARTDDGVAGYAMVRSWCENDNLSVFLHDGYVHPQVRRCGVGGTLIGWAERRIDAFASTDGAQKWVYAANSSTSEPARSELLTSRGYALVFSLVEMSNVSELPAQPQTPPGIEIRNARTSEIEALWQLNEIAYCGRNFTAVTSVDSFNKFSSSITNLEQCLVALSGDQIAGFVAGRVSGSYGEVVEVTVHPQFRRRGTAKALLWANLASLRAAGAREIRLHTNGEDVSGARSLYAQLGFRVTKTHNRYRKSPNARVQPPGATG